MVRIKIKPVGDNNYVGYFSDRDKIGTYLKEKINVFKENMLLVIDKLDDYSYDFDEKACSLLKPVFDYYDDMKLRYEMREKEKAEEEHYRKVVELMASIGNDYEEKITKMKEFRKDLLLDNIEDIVDYKKNKR